MKIALLADLHEKTPYISHVDAAIFAGDFMFQPPGSYEEERRIWISKYAPYFMDLMSRGIETFGIPGNHDFYPMARMEILDGMFSRWMESGTHTLGQNFDIFSYCWCKMERWAYYRPMEKQESDLFCFESLEYDMVVTHTPPYGILDRCSDGDLAGSTAIRDFVDMVKPKYHVFGHIHEAYGMTEINGTKYINVSYCDQQYKPRLQYPVLDTITGKIDIVKTIEVNL